MMTIEELLGRTFELQPAPRGEQPVRFQVIAYDPESWPRAAFFTVRVLNAEPLQQPIALLMFEAAIRAGALQEIG